VERIAAKVVATGARLPGYIDIGVIGMRTSPVPLPSALMLKPLLGLFVAHVSQAVATAWPVFPTALLIVGTA
jgi:hypothetical protein